MLKLQVYLATKSNWPSFDYLGQFFSIFLLVGIILVMAYLSYRLLSSSRHAGKNGTERNLQIIESIGVGVQTTVQIIRSGEKYFLLGVAKEKVTLLAELDKETLKLRTDKNILVNSPFDKVLKRILKKDIEKNEDKDEEA